MGKSPEIAPGLHVTATPIGNARDISLRALDVLNGVDLILAEDTRVTAKLLAIHGVRKPLAPYNDHNAARERPKILVKLRGGARIALVSDAGTPLVSDPGFKLVREAIAEGLAVHAVPGASAVLTGLVLSGLPTDRFLFAGFLPPRQGARRHALEGLKGERASLVFFESTQRLAVCLKDMNDILGSRDAAVLRELTKLHEEARRGTLAELVDYYAGSMPKGEVTLIVSGAASDESDVTSLDAVLKDAMAYMPLRAAVDLVAAASGKPRGGLYDRALKLKADGEN
jgi:16S rRNA (cytidine1402-2'-O)-methyltransferase